VATDYHYAASTLDPITLPPCLSVGRSLDLIIRFLFLQLFVKN
jgi:hypothetical protein